MKKLAIYGKGGIGKSTLCCNVSAILAKRGMRVMQIGCDPKADSTALLHGGQRIPTVLGLTREKGTALTLSDAVCETASGVICVEAGGPVPGHGCAGRGIINALEWLERMGAYDIYRPDLVLYDVLGDVVCGGFAMPMRKGYADSVFVLTSGEKMSCYAAANICMAAQQFKSRGYAQLGGLILNRRGTPDEDAAVQTLADDFDTAVLAALDRAPEFAEAEARGLTVAEAFPDSQAAQQLAAVADALLRSSGGTT